MIAIDWTLGISALIFLITLVGLNRILFQPLMAVLEKRKAATSGAFERAEDGQDLYEQKVSEYEERLKEVRQQGYLQAETVRNEALEQRQSQVAATRAKAESLVKESRQRLEDELEQARRQLQQDAQEIALGISERILSRQG